MARNPKSAENGQGSASDANAGGGSRGGAQRRGRRPRQWLEHGTGCLRAAFPFTSSMLAEALRSLMAALAKGATQAAETTTAPTAGASSPAGGWTSEAWEYWVDAMQRQILFWDVLRKRGNQAIEHYKAGKPPVLVFDYEMVVDGRQLERPVNYALVRIKPEAGETIDPKKRPFVIVDPRAGHGPGIGGFKEESEVGVALRAGHPVYFVTFFPEPEPGQTIEDIGRAEVMFLRKVGELHPEAEGKPVVVGNCQAGWAIMMMAAAAPRPRRDRRDRRLAAVLLGGRRGQEPDALHRRPARRHLAHLAHGRPRQRQVRRRASGAELREPEPRQHALGQALQPLLQGRHRGAALPRLREVVERLLLHHQGGDARHHRRAVRRQQADQGHDPDLGSPRASTSGTSARRSW